MNLPLFTPPARPFSLLCIDPGQKSGVVYDWGLGSQLVVARATKASERAEHVQRAYSCATGRKVPLIVVAEDWNVAGMAMKRVGADRDAPYGLSAQTVLGMGASWGWWEQLVDECERYRVGDQRTWPKVVRVKPETWKRWTLGRARPTREKGQELTLQRARHNVAVARTKCRVIGEVTDENVAVAVLIYEWARKAAEVRELLGSAAA